MYFMDRVSLGKALADDLQQYRGKDAVIMALSESSLLTCLTVAMRLRAWVYPVLFVPIYSPVANGKLLGAYDGEGNFIINPHLKIATVSSLRKAEQAEIERKKAHANSAIIARQADYEVTIDKHIMDGRDVIIMADVMTSVTSVAVAMRAISTVHPKSVSVAIGNASTEVANLVRIEADKVIIKDVLSGPIKGDDQYFQHPDAYTTQQKRTLTKHIATYWQ